MPPRIARCRRFGTVLGTFLALVCVVSTSAAAQELSLLRDYPGSGPYQCPAPVSPILPSPDERARAGQLATDANEAMIIGDFERVEALLLQSVELDPSSADMAYRHARVLADLERNQDAMVEFCRALDLNVAALGITDARLRLNGLSEELRARIPEPARNAFAQGLRDADDSLFVAAIGSFTNAVDAAPEWPEPLYNRAVIHERMNRRQEAISDFRRYLRLVAPDETDAILVSQRIGALEGAASIIPPSPMGALALGVIPGMGHYYTSRPVPGTLTLTTAGLAMVAGFGFRTITTLCLSEERPGGRCPPGDVIDESVNRPYMWIGVGVGAAITFVGAIDAYRKAKARRQEAELIRDPGANPGQEARLNIGLPSVSVYGDQVDLNFFTLRFR